MELGLEGMGESLLTILLWIIGGVVLIALALSSWFGGKALFKYLRYKKKVIYFYKEGDKELKRGEDKGGVFLDKKTNSKRFFLKKMDSSLDADSIDKSTFCDIVFLWKKGEKSFAPLEFNIDDNKNLLNLIVGEEDLNWALNTYEREKKRHDRTSLLLQYAPYISLLVVAMVFLVVFIYFFKRLDVLQSFGENLKLSMDIMVTVSENLAKAQGVIG